MTDQSGVGVARRKLVQTLSTEGSGPSAELVDEAARGLTEAKREANVAWLDGLGALLWRIGLAVGLVAAVVTVAVNSTPGAAQQTVVQTSDLQTDLTALRGELGADDGATLSPTEIESARDRIEALQAAVDGLAGLVEDIPETWNGQSMSGQARGAVEAQGGIAAGMATLTELSQGDGPVRSEAVAAIDELDTAVASLLDVDLSLRWAFPWDFTNQAASGFVHAILATILLLGLLFVLVRHEGGLRHFLIDSDGRFSTSQTQAAIWSVAVYFLLAHLLLRARPGDFRELDENYLLLLGGPYAAWVIGGAVSRGKLDSESLQQVSAPEAQVKDLVSDDDGRASLTDAQFFCFSLLALIGVFVAFNRDPAQLPEIPTGLAMLTSAAALVYTGKKVLDRNAPVVHSVSRQAGEGPISPGTAIVLRGAHFLPPGGGGDLDVLTGVTVHFVVGDATFDRPVIPTLRSGAADRVRTADRAREEVTNPRSDRILVEVPPLPAGAGTVSLVTASGVRSNDVQIDVADAVTIQWLKLVGTDQIRVAGFGFAPQRVRTFTRAGIGDSTAVPFTWEDDHTILLTAPGPLVGPIVVKLSNHRGSAQETLVT